MKKFWISMIVILLCGGCAGQVQEVNELSIPTRIHTPTQTVTPLPSATPTALVFTDHGGRTEPYPNLKVITAENVHRLEEVAVWGQGMVLGIALSPDATTIAVSTPTGIYFYDAGSMEQIDWINFAMAQTDYASMRPYRSYDNLDYSPDGKSLLIGFDNLYIIDLETRVINRFELTETDMYGSSYVMETTYSQDGKHILVVRASLHGGFYEMLFEIYELNTANTVFQYDFKSFDSYARLYLVNDHEAAIEQILVEINAGEIIRKEEPFNTGVEEHTIVFEELSADLWRVTLPQENISCDYIEKGAWYGMNDYSEDQLTWIAFHGDNSELNVFHFDACQKSEQSIYFPEAFGEFNISAKGNFVTSGNSWGNYHIVWDIVTGDAIAFQESDEMFFDAFDSELFSINESLSREEKDTKTVIKNAVSGDVLFQIEDGPLSQFIKKPKDSDVFFLNNHLISLSQTNPIVKKYGEYPYQFSPDGKYVVYLVKQSKHPYAFLYFDSAINGELVPTETITILIPSPSGLDNTEIDDFQLSHTGRYVVFYGKDEFLVWDLFDEKPVIIHDETENGYIVNLTFLPDDELLLIREAPYGSGKISFYDLKNQQVVYEFIPPKILSLGPEISPDGKRMVFLGYDGTIRIYGARSETK